MNSMTNTWERAAEVAAARVEQRYHMMQSPITEIDAVDSIDQRITFLSRGSGASDLDLSALGAYAFGKCGIDKHYLVELLAQKQHSYGHDNINRFGLQGILVRLSDKVCRLRNLLARGEDPQFAESVEDSWTDIVGYAVIGLMLEAGTFDLPLKADIVVPKVDVTLTLAAPENDWGLAMDGSPMKRAVTEDNKCYTYVDGAWTFQGEDSPF